MSLGRRAVLYALVIALVWFFGMNLFARFVPGIPTDFRAHLQFGLMIFALLILVPLIVTLWTMNWVARRITGAIMIVLWLGMVRGIFASSSSILGGIAGALVPTMLIGALLYYLSHPAVMRVMDDYYNFLNVRDLPYVFTRKRRPA